MTATSKLLLIAAGGSGGHLFPAQQLAELWLQDPSHSLLFAGYRLTMSPYFQRERFPFHEIPAAPPHKHPLRFLWGIWKSLLLLWRTKPSIVVGFGSYHTAPVLLAAALLRKKVILYEPNWTLGKVNRLIAPFAEAIAAPFPLPRKKRVAVPLFPWILPPLPDRLEARRYFGLAPDAFALLVFGGSQGAAFLNSALPEVARRLGAEVLHLAGSEEAARSTRLAYEKRGVRAVVKPFEHQMPLAYAAADFAVCRSGAGTLGELIRYRIPSLLIPFPAAADNHQWHNACYLQKAGGALLLLQSDATEEALATAIRSADLAAMRAALASVQDEGAIGLDALLRRHLP